MLIKRINVDGRTGTFATFPKGHSMYGMAEINWDDGGNVILFMDKKSKSKKISKGTNETIRQGVLSAVKKEKASCPFRLKGPGCEVLVTLDRSLAGILRGQEIPRVSGGGSSPRFFYPARIFVRASKVLLHQLGWNPLVFAGTAKNPETVHLASEPTSK